MGHCIKQHEEKAKYHHSTYDFDSTWDHSRGPILPTKLLKISEICNFPSLFLLPIQPFFRPLLHLFSQSFPCVVRIC
jgi:hypothetical protein